MIRRTMATSLLSLCLCGAQILLSCSAEKSGQGFRIGAIKTGTPPVIDGHVDDPAWQNAEAVWLKENRSGEEVGDSRLSTRVMTCYDDRTY